MLKGHEPIFGKNVIETLSEGMYDNPLFLYREYVQNAADAIDAAVEARVLEKDEGQIQITIDSDKRQVVFLDNGIGIAKRDVPAMLANIGNSQKDRLKNKGFRGIGRLGGLGYCRIVRFETSIKGESVKSVLEWDADALHAILIDQREQIDAGELIKRITTVRTEKTNIDEHFFRVSLIDILETSDDLLDVEDVRKYLSMVAPVPFDYQRFRFVLEIETFINENRLPKLHEYQVYLNGDEIRKGYATPLVIDGGTKTVEVLGVECRILKHEDKTVGWYWFCVSRFEGVLPKACWQRCIRLRKSNIQIGEADCLSNHPKRGQALWKEDTIEKAITGNNRLVVGIPYNQLLIGLFHLVVFVKIHSVARRTTGLAEGQLAQSSNLCNHIGRILPGNDVKFVVSFVSVFQFFGLGKFRFEQFNRYGINNCIHFDSCFQSILDGADFSAKAALC